MARTHPRPSGRFSKRVRITRTGSHKRARLRATFSRNRSRAVPVTIVDSGNCALDQPGSVIGMSLPGCKLVASDTASKPDPRSFWGTIECGLSWGNPIPSRHQQLTSGGDPHITGTGAPQGDSAYRQLTVYDGDDYSGERCELGKNDHKIGPTAFYHEGQRRVTYVSIRLPDNFDLSVDTWQDVLQMKEAQPYDSAGNISPILYMGARDNEWRINSNNGLWGSFPAQNDFWTRFAFDVTYSQDPSKGSVQVSADLNGDGDFDDPGERTAVTHTATLITETNGPMGTSDGLAPGDSIPSHLRAGIYHNPSIPCPAPSGCSVEIDNVQVLKSPSGP